MNWCTNYELGDKISCGEESLITETKEKYGFKDFQKGKWQEAVNFFQKQRANNGNNPEILIYLNNAKLMQKARNTTYTIAVVVPSNQNNNSQGVAEALLRGVAQVQEEFNKENSNIGLKVLIVNDENNPDQVAKLAENLLSKDDVVAVIGHYTSEVTKAALPVYQKNEVVVISPGSTAMRETILYGKTYSTNYFFRTVPTVKTVNRLLIDKLQLSQLFDRQKVAVFYNPNSTYSKSFFQEVRQQLGDNKIIAIDISNPGFIAKNILINVKKEGAKALILIPDGHVKSQSFKNTLSLINLNRDELPMGGGSVIYDPDILKTIDINRVKKLVLVISWHRLTTPNQEVIAKAKNLWGTGDISDKTAMSYDATLVLTEALKKLNINDDVKRQRLDIQKQLTQLQVTAGASGKISFDSDGDRKEEISEIVKVVSVPRQCSEYSAMFVPINYDVTKLPCYGKVSK
ncbi:amino acid ABC transporter substrate-binding protein [Anabaena sp. FACHB-1237]|uniref:ABC transporter substrate-binding protein n=1 Tax=Anabaena sp. FACHB-1237 TaxID=2692769 RepID=UPI001680DB08|nr:ABC transporter substrate-binding protein [Anabaena sp. FACHB-1237]MBD2138486.1 amino acid ABC transporter substrate-binding protein [Anabaena sp. FACHB-1237]